MTWNTLWPDGSKTVKANETPGQQNTTYIKTTMQEDHYWDEDGTKDGRHKKVEMDTQSADPGLTGSMTGVLYLKDVADGRPQVFYDNGTVVYQATPVLLKGTHVVSSSYSNLVAVPDDTYGEIFMFITGSNGKTFFQAGGFRATNGKCEAWPYRQRNQNNTSAYNLAFGNGSAGTSLNIRVKTDAASSGKTWAYRVTYRDI